MFYVLLLDIAVVLLDVAIFVVSLNILCKSICYSAPPLFDPHRIQNGAAGTGNPFPDVRPCKGHIKVGVPRALQLLRVLKRM